MAFSPATAWALYVLIFFAWHDGNAYSLALRFGSVHGLEHFTFLGAALLFWWHVTGAAPRIHTRPAQWLREGREEGREEGWQKGRQAGCKQVALNMLAQKADISFVSSVTGLSLKEIQKLK